MKLPLHVADIVHFLLTVRGSSSSADQVHASSGLVETPWPAQVCHQAVGHVFVKQEMKTSRKFSFKSQ